MRRHKAFCSYAERIIHKVNHWHLFKDFYKIVFQGEHRGCSLRPWEGFLSSIQSLSHARLFATPWITARQASLSITNSWSSLRLTSIESVMPSSHLILWHPLLLLPSILSGWTELNWRVISQGSTTWIVSFQDQYNRWVLHKNNLEKVKSLVAADDERTGVSPPHTLICFMTNASVMLKKTLWVTPQN